MRLRARQDGTLQSSQEETVTTDGQDIAVEPADPETISVPEYDPWLAYGDPIDMYPGWDPYPGLFLDDAGLAWGAGLGVYTGFAWGWYHWHADWHHHRLDFNHQPYVTHAPAFPHPNTPDNRPDYARIDGFDSIPVHGPALSHDQFAAPENWGTATRMASHSQAFQGFDRGAIAGTYAFHGTSSPGGFHGGFAGGFHGGGFGGHR